MTNKKRGKRNLGPYHTLTNFSLFILIKISPNKMTFYTIISFIMISKENCMKKLRFVTILLYAVVFLISCNLGVKTDPSLSEGKTLKVVSNVTRIQEARSIGDGVEGVLLTFHNGSGNTITSSFEITDDETVYLEALGRTLYTEDNRVYNYVLYMPELIRSMYKDYCQVSDDRGSSVWWYFSQYYEVERGDWSSALNAILNNQKGLTFPKEEEIGESWVPQAPSKSQKINIDARIFSYDPANDTSYGGDDLYNKEFRHYYVEKNNHHLICIPVQIYTTFQLGGGTSTLNPDDMVNAAMYWYLEKYFDVTPDGLKAIVQEGMIDEFLNDVNKKNIKAKPEDVTSGYRTVVRSTIPSSITAENFEIRSAYAYLPGTLVFDDGTFITDNERPYIIVDEWSNNRTVYWIYLPSSLISSYEEYIGGVWNGENDLFAYYLYKSGLAESYNEAETYVHGNCLIKRDLLQQSVRVIWTDI